MKLKPCPFCGGEVSMALTGCGSINWVFITRGNSEIKKNCKCRLFMESERYAISTVEHEEKERIMSDLAAAWNRRVGDDLMERMEDDGK
jgi:hypothetical protein